VTTDEVLRFCTIESKRCRVNVDRGGDLYFWIRRIDKATREMTAATKVLTDLSDWLHSKDKDQP
jgi:hypothetical protein